MFRHVIPTNYDYLQLTYYANGMKKYSLFYKNLYIISYNYKSGMYLHCSPIGRFKEFISRLSLFV